MIKGIRWVAVSGLEAHGGIVRGVIPGFSSFMDQHFKLQYLDLSGRWRDVKIAATGKLGAQGG